MTDDGCVRVLFLGNSYTSTNDLPGMFTTMAAAAGRKVQVAMVANGGETLAQHASSGDDEAQLNAEPWNYVVLQEQSEIPALSSARPQMAAAVSSLADRIRGRGATPLLFETWGHRYGLPDSGFADFADMQAALRVGYEAAGSGSSVGLVRVGEAWSAAIQADPALNLWQEDGSHPNPAGTYLAALVFYATIFDTDLSRLTSISGAPDGGVAEQLVAAAQSIVK